MNLLKKKVWDLIVFVVFVLVGIFLVALGETMNVTSRCVEYQYIGTSVGEGDTQCVVSSLNVSRDIATNINDIDTTTIRVEDLGFHDAVVNYCDDFVVDKNWFIDEIPDYIELKLLTEEIDFDIGENYVYIRVYSRSVYYLIEGDDIIICKLTILPSELDSSGFSFVGGEYEYTGEEISLKVDGVDEDLIAVEYEKYMVVDSSLVSVSKIIDIGQYFVKAKLSSIVPEYSLNLTLTADVCVVKKGIDITDYSELVTYVSTIYDGKHHAINLFEESLPSDVTIASVTGVDKNDSFKDVVRKEFVINLDYDDEHFTCVDSISCVFEILPKPLNVALSESQFVYSGLEPTLEWSVSELEDGDTLDISYTGLGINADTYSVVITGIGNPNYSISNNVFDVEIFKADITISESDFENVYCIYDGAKQLPKFIGNLPDGISARMEDKTCIDADVYSVVCIFSGANNNYNTPNNFSFNFNILPRPVTACFVLPEDMIASDNAKIISVEFDGAVAGEIVLYDGKYSGDTCIAGVYNYTIELKNDNYILSNSDSFEFVVYASELQAKDSDVSIRINGKFNPNSQVTIANLTTSPEIIHSIEMDNLNGFKVYKIDFENLSVGRSKLTIKSSDVCDNSQYLKVYSMNSLGNWAEVDYSVVGNNIVLNISSGETLLFAEYKTPVEKNLSWILIIVSLFIFSSIMTVVFSRINVKNNKRNMS